MAWKVNIFPVVLYSAMLFTIVKIASAIEIGYELSPVVSKSMLLQSLYGIHATQERTIEMEELRKHIRQQYHIQTDVNKPSVGFMIDVFEQLVQGGEITSVLGHTDGRTLHRLHHSDTIRSVTATQNQDGSLEFSVPALPSHEHVKMVEVRFFDNVITNKHRRLMLRLKKDGHVGKQTITMKAGKRSLSLAEHILSEFDRLKGNCTLTLKQKSVHDVDRFQTTSLPIIIIYSHDRGFMRSALKSLTKSESAQSQQTIFSRRKRASGDEHNSKSGRVKKRNPWRIGKKNPEPCGVKDFKVDFNLIGWGPWIIHPKTFNARACFGQCPEPISSKYSPTNHAMLQTLMRMKRPLSAPENCCVATKLRPLSMLYFEYDDIVVRHHEDMVVDECGCR